MGELIQLLARIQLEAEDLIKQYPPRFQTGPKRMLFERITSPIAGLMEVSRWTGELPQLVESAGWPELEIREEVFSYPPAEPGTTVWHLNFADPNLFGYYGGPLLAQDEHQVLEHPVLGSVREALLDLQVTRPELAPLTRQGEPTPYLIKGATRSLAFDTVRGPYGKAFAVAPREDVLRFTSFLNPPTHSNIVAMAAPFDGDGHYRQQEIRDILRTAFVGFSACKRESPSRTVVHTGHWGCGAFGGNRVMMALLQLCAARLAAIDKLVYHTMTSAGTESYKQGLELVHKLAPGPEIETDSVLASVEALGLEWGHSDGN